ncbi:hypothetical protein [Rhodanobacter sp. DHB23]|uniref:hypothetical protein n=1 Tax=Rhodanobacter sp. DHB23 TaxID=2775923 RepID=UPI00177AA57A|nr:hypothetical protein [Rhodanobacter sp. DHB23]MBD8874142.1 hypothetical protein [Rhodanobacter sp. DHB23]
MYLAPDPVRINKSLRADAKSLPHISTWPASGAVCAQAKEERRHAGRRQGWRRL